MSRFGFQNQRYLKAHSNIFYHQNTHTWLGGKGQQQRPDESYYNLISDSSHRTDRVEKVIAKNWRKREYEATEVQEYDIPEIAQHDLPNKLFESKRLVNKKQWYYNTFISK